MTLQPENTPSCHLASISLALGFLVIWTAVLAGVLVSHTLQEETKAHETLNIFRIHEDVGKIAFALGHEMVTTVDALLSQNLQKQHQQGIVNVTWKITDEIIKLVQENNYVPWVSSMENLMDTLIVKLRIFRENVISLDTNPLDVIRFYIDLMNWLVDKCAMLDYNERHFPVHCLPYSLFIRGMFQRFGEIAFGTVYVKSSMPISKLEFVGLMSGSETLMEAAFRFTPKAATKWWELQEQEPQVQKIMDTVIEDILNDGPLRGQREVAIAYLEGAKEQVAMLLLTKEVLNNTLSTIVNNLSIRTHNTLAFHMSVAIVAVIAVVLCLTVTGCTCSYLSKGHMSFPYKSKLTVKQKQTAFSYGTSDSLGLINEKAQCYM